MRLNIDVNERFRTIGLQPPVTGRLKRKLYRQGVKP